MQVYLTKDALKEYQHLSIVEQTKVKRKLKELEDDPYVGKKLSGKLEGKHSLRAWPYRILYVIRNNSVYVIAIAHRQGAYN